MSVRAVRGAVQLSADDPDEMHREVGALLAQVLEVNALSLDSVISAFFTVTPDLVSEFPAAAARLAGWTGIPLMCAVEIAVSGSLPRVVRAMIHVETTLERDQISHIYRGGARALRPDLAP